MQTSPKKTVVALGAVLLALAVGGFALWSANRSHKAPDTAQTQQLSPDTGAAAADGTDKQTATNDGTDEAATPASGTSVTSPAGGTTTTTTTATTPAGTIPEYHVVQVGETLRDIAQHYYNDPIYSADIEALNNLDNPNMIKPGDKLMLPKKDDLKKKGQ
jgi:nucleoid-associated protein YgaU